MTNIKIAIPALTILLITSVLISGCLTTKKMDVFVAEQYNNTLPVPDKKKNPAVTITSAIPFTPENSISVTKHKTTQVLPLVVYWLMDDRSTSTLNPALAVSSFSNVVAQQSAKMNQKLNGRQLQITVEQVPNAFALVDRITFILILFHFDKIYVEPDFKDLVVSYKLLENGAVVKTNKITIKNEEKSRGVGFLQSWKSSTSEYLSQYNTNIVTMSRGFINKLVQEL